MSWIQFCLNPCCRRKVASCAAMIDAMPDGLRDHLALAGLEVTKTQRNGRRPFFGRCRRKEFLEFAVCLGVNGEKFVECCMGQMVVVGLRQVEYAVREE